MTMQSRSNRYYWRQRNRRLMSLINALLAALVLLAVILPSVASASPRCPGGTATPHGCVYQPAGMTCAWPLIINGERVTWCVRYAAEVQP